MLINLECYTLIISLTEDPNLDVYGYLMYGIRLIIISVE